MSGGMVFCRACGGTLHSSAPFCPHCGAPQGAAGSGDGIARTFGASVAMCFRKYAVFQGRAPRAEYWWFALFQFLVNMAFGILQASSGADAISVVSALFALATFLPSIAVWVRRLHDVDRSGWWAWIILVPLVGWVLVLVWACTRGTRGPNRFGPENGLVS
jgi:uncharacterized membrane protein YhaH (DUF805 family)